MLCCAALLPRSVALYLLLVPALLFISSVVWSGISSLLFPSRYLVAWMKPHLRAAALSARHPVTPSCSTCSAGGAAGLSTQPVPPSPSTPSPVPPSSPFLPWLGAQHTPHIPLACPRAAELRPSVHRAHAELCVHTHAHPWGVPALHRGALALTTAPDAHARD